MTVDSNYTRICVLLENYYPSIGGVETQTKLIIENLVRKGMRFIILTRRYSQSLPEVERGAGITIFRIPPMGEGDIFKKWQMLIPAFMFLVRLRKEYDIIFVPGFNALGISASLVARIFSKRCVFRAVSNLGELSGAHSLLALKKRSLSPFILFLKFVLWLKKKLLQKADEFVATTKELEEDFLSNGVEPEKIVRIPNGVNTAIYHPVSLEDKLTIRQKLSIPINKVIVMYVGRLERLKGVTLLLKIWPRVVNNCPEAHLYLVGPGGDCEDELKESAHSQGISRDVTFTGGVGNVHEYLKAADIFTSASEYEAFGISVIEALACGLPVVVTRVGGMKETVKNNEHGFTISPNHLSNFYESLVTLIRDGSLRERMGQASRVWVEQMFSIESVADKYFDLFKSLPNKKKKVTFSS